MSVIKHLKEIVTEIGVPRCIVSDSGTQFTAQEFQDFTRRWDIQHRITFPTNAQSNGKAEWFVQTIKNSLTKAMEGGGRPISSNTLIHHNTLEPQFSLTSRVTKL